MRVQLVADDDGVVVMPFPQELEDEWGLAEGTILDAEVVRRGEDKPVVIIRLVVMPSNLTVVQDRYQGTYAGAPWLAWPLPESVIPAKAQGDDIEAAAFWVGNPYLVGKGLTPEEAKADLAHQLAMVRQPT